MNICMIGAGYVGLVSGGGKRNHTKQPPKLLSGGCYPSTRRTRACAATSLDHFTSTILRVTLNSALFKRYT